VPAHRNRPIGPHLLGRKAREQAHRTVADDHSASASRSPVVRGAPGPAPCE
jgi:hypothetical protein